MKRLLDVLAATVMLVVCSPLIAVVSLLLLVTTGLPILFRQVRPGYKGRPFTIFKFRTMNDARGPDGRLLPDPERLTAAGKLLRRFSLDEMPQLWNVLKGDMSLVGPRPLLMEYLDRYTPEQARRHDVRPGITGWAQVHGRNDLLFSRRLELDVWYVDHHSLSLDARILCMTFSRTIKRSGVRLQQDLAEVDDIGLNPETSKSGKRVS